MARPALDERAAVGDDRLAQLRQGGQKIQEIGASLARRPVGDSVHRMRSAGDWGLMLSSSFVTVSQRRSATICQTASEPAAAAAPRRRRMLAA